MYRTLGITRALAFVPAYAKRRPVQSGRFAVRREVVQAGLDALRDRDAAVEHLLQSDVVLVAAAMMADASRAIPLDEAFDAIERRHAARVVAGARGA